MRMRTYVRELHQRLRYLDNSYLKALADGSLSREDFVETQVQFLFAVVFFARPMAMLAGRLPRPEMRLPLLENVQDEHGHGNLRLSHERTFLQFLERFGETAERIERRALWPEVRAFNTLLGGVCSLDDTLTAMATLGIIEDMFANISSSIAKGVVARRWLDAKSLVHYAVHEELDVEHADGFYRQLDGPWESHPRHEYQITQGLELGGYAFMRLYEDLYASRGRRWTRDVEGPHSLADGWYLDVEARMHSMHMRVADPKEG